MQFIDLREILDLLVVYLGKNIKMENVMLPVQERTW